MNPEFSLAIGICILSALALIPVARLLWASRILLLALNGRSQVLKDLKRFNDSKD